MQRDSLGLGGHWCNWNGICIDVRRWRSRLMEKREKATRGFVVVAFKNVQYHRRCFRTTFGNPLIKNCMCTCTVCS